MAKQNDEEILKEDTQQSKDHKHTHKHCHNDHSDCNCNHEHCKHDDNHEHCKHDDNHEHCKCDNGCDSDVSSDALGYLELAQRIQADFENYKRRNADLEKTSFQNGVNAFVSKLLPVMDSFKQAKLTISDENALKGIDIIHNQILNALNSFGIHKIECLGEKFDPNLHNAVMTDCDETKDDEIILEELQEGFKTDSKVIRHSVVKVNKR